MAQFDIYLRQQEGVEYLLDLQDDMLSTLNTRVVAPLISLDMVNVPMKTVNLLINLGGREFLLLIHLLAAIPVSALGQPVGSASSQRNDIIAALDMLFTGI